MASTPCCRTSTSVVACVHSWLQAGWALTPIHAHFFFATVESVHNREVVTSAAGVPASVLHGLLSSGTVGPGGTATSQRCPCSTLIATAGGLSCLLLWSVVAKTCTYNHAVWCCVASCCGVLCHAVQVRTENPWEANLFFIPTFMVVYTGERAEQFLLWLSFVY